MKMDETQEVKGNKWNTRFFEVSAQFIENKEVLKSKNRWF